jgi:predicted GNAT superfamily acetyltransferase
MFQFKRLIDIEEIKSVQFIEQQVWDAEPTPIHQTYTAAKNGGLVLGAYKDSELIGFQYSFPGFKDGRSYLCSHMLGILPAYRKSGVGKELKFFQRELAREMGYSLIVWTYDPLESVNAYLNLHRLKGIAGTYLENHYGRMSDSLNEGMPTDRFLIEWWINSEHVEKESSEPGDELNNHCVKTKLDKNGFPHIMAEYELNFAQDVVFCPIPENIQQMKKQHPELALEWRYKTRKWFQTLCQNGYVAEDVKRNVLERTSFYVFRKRDSLDLKD